MKQPLDMSPLAAEYDIVGQLDGGSDTSTYIATRKGDSAKRRDDPTGVLITVVTTPEGDEANALPHLAADIKLLAHTPHRRLTPVIEGIWLGDDAFAVITQRSTDPSLSQRLASGETFTNPRIAAILREVNGLLEWAREQKVVHRSIPASRLYLEPKTDRVRVTFAIAPILRLHRTNAQDDARTIARLAMAMLTGDEDPQAYAGKSLVELRSDLPERLGEATAALLDEKNTGVSPDVAAYLALIGMADPVAAGEAERERVRTDILEEQRAEREKLAAERASFELAMATERATFESTKAEERERLENERVELQKKATLEREALQRAVEQERAQLVAKRAELERTVTEQRAEMERAAAQDREQIARLREDIRRAGEREIELKRQTALDDMANVDESVDADNVSTPRFVAPMLAPLEPLTFNDDSPLMADDAIVFAPSSQDDDTSAGELNAEQGASEDQPSRRKWILVGSLAAVLVVVGLAASVVGSRVPSAQAVRPAAPIASAPGAPVTTAPATAAPPAPIAMDSVAMQTATRWLDSLKEANPVEFTRRQLGIVSTEPRAPVERATPAERRTPSINENPFFIPGSTPSRPDTTRPPRR